MRQTLRDELRKAHVEILAELFRRLREANFTVRPVKCVLGSSTIDFLGHRLGQGTISLQDENVKKVRNAPRPKTKKEVKSFLGLVGYFEEFVPNFAAISATPNFSPVFNFFEDLTSKGLTTLASQVTQFQPGIAFNNYLL
ncbi:Pol polyprotein [Elysia marginata]|uniref:Pol polyprotein n=1 Tax=Elysia marginata TaxID=1093978 RepID=A0AAV4G625_9GAST|nr:Pol polyprotein [Elysia marginata]